MKVSSWLTRSGQYWKYRVFWGLLSIGVIAFLLLLLEINSGDESIGWYATTVMLSGAFAFVWLGNAITCRTCHTRVAWWYLTHSNAGDWLTDLGHSPRCPVCGDDERASALGGRSRLTQNDISPR